MILRSPFVTLVFLAALSFATQQAQAQHQQSDGPSVQECQPYIDAALRAFQYEHVDDDDDVTQVHSAESNDVDVEDIENETEAPQADQGDENDEDEKTIKDDENDVSETESTETETDDDDDDEDHHETKKHDIEDEEENKAEDDTDDDHHDETEKHEAEADDDDEDDHATHDEKEDAKAEIEDDDDDDDKKHEDDVESQDEKHEENDEDDEKHEESADDEKPEEDEDEEKEKHTDAVEDDDNDEEEEKKEKREIPSEEDAATESQEQEHDVDTEGGEPDEHQEVKEATKEEEDDEAEHVEEENTEDEKTDHDDVEKETETVAEDESKDYEKTAQQEETEKSEEVDEVEVAVNATEQVVDDHEASENATQEVDGEAETETEGETAEEEEEEVLVAGPGQLRSRDHIEEILEVSEQEVATNSEREKIGGDILKELKKMYEGAVRPLEQLYQFRDISNRHLGDAEIFSKPMVVFMGPWSTGKSAIINYLLGTEYTRSALKTGAEPTSNSFNVILYGEQDQVIDGTQLAADWAFSSLQKFGQGFLDRLKGRKMNNPILRKMTIVDTPGILENRKSGERLYPFNDAFQWFIDRADIIYIVFDPTKLDIGLEMEALFDQLKGRENQIRILLNKADIVKPQELMKVQGNILWNLSPLLTTVNAPTIFVGSFWSKPYLPGSPATLFEAQEEAFLEDIHEALDTQVENKVALARRHAVRVRNHAKMVDCYLNTYYNHKSFFSNKKQVANDIVDNPQHYHIYEGMSTLTNVSRYDLPDPDIYREFFSVHPLFDFKPLASTCSYFKGCPLDKLDITIAYDLPELVGKYHRILSNRPQVVGGVGGR